jgi:hypothetical protein
MPRLSAACLLALKRRANCCVDKAVGMGHSTLRAAHIAGSPALTLDDDRRDRRLLSNGFVDMMLWLSLTYMATLRQGEVDEAGCPSRLSSSRLLVSCLNLVAAVLHLSFPLLHLRRVPSAIGGENVVYRYIETLYQT